MDLQRFQNAPGKVLTAEKQIPTPPQREEPLDRPDTPIETEGRPEPKPEK